PSTSKVWPRHTTFAYVSLRSRTERTRYTSPSTPDAPANPPKCEAGYSNTRRSGRYRPMWGFPANPRGRSGIGSPPRPVPVEGSSVVLVYHGHKVISVHVG